MFGIDCAEPSADVAVWMTEEELYWKALTQKGERLTAQIAELFVETEETQVEEQKKAIREIVEKLPNAQMS